MGGWVSDVIGRRITLIFSLAINALAGVLSALAPSLAWLSFLRVCAGVGKPDTYMSLVFIPSGGLDKLICVCEAGS